MSTDTTPDTRCDCITTRGTRCQRPGEFYVGATVGKQLMCKPHFKDMVRGNPPRFARAYRLCLRGDCLAA